MTQNEGMCSSSSLTAILEMVTCSVCLQMFYATSWLYVYFSFCNIFLLLIAVFSCLFFLPLSCFTPLFPFSRIIAEVIGCKYLSVTGTRRFAPSIWTYISMATNATWRQSVLERCIRMRTWKIWHARNGLDLSTALGTWVRRWSLWAGLYVNIQSENIFFVEMSFVGRKEKHRYAVRLTAIINQIFSRSAHNLPINSLYYIDCTPV